MSLLLSLGFIAVSVAPALAQIASSCNPILANQTKPCPANAALGTSHTWNMANETMQDTDIWNITNGVVGYSNGAAQFVISKKGQAPTIQSNFYFLWGSSAISLKASSGQGIVSSLTYLSNDLDEIDWEWIGGNNTHVQTNYFGKGNVSTYDRAIWVPVDDPIGKFHNYSINWSATQLQWLVDGKVVRNMPYAKANGNGEQYPQTPMDVRMGIWAGGDLSSGNTNWTVEWAGGAVDYSKAPFTMQVQSVSVDDGTKGAKEYTYGDKTGKWQSIKVAQGNSTTFNALNKAPAQTIEQKFNSLSTAAKIGIAAGIGGAALLLAVICTFCCVRQRRVGRREREVADADWNRNNGEILAYKESQLSAPVGHSPNPFSDSKMDLPQYGGYSHGGYNMVPTDPNVQYTPQQHRF